MQYRRGTGEYKVTNYERIKQMSIEEMQRFLARVDSCDIDMARTYCDVCKGEMRAMGEWYECDDCVRWWLELDSKEHPQGIDYTKKG